MCKRRSSKKDLKQVGWGWGFRPCAQQSQRHEKGQHHKRRIHKKAKEQGVLLHIVLPKSCVLLVSLHAGSHPFGTDRNRHLTHTTSLLKSGRGKGRGTDTQASMHPPLWASPFSPLYGGDAAGLDFSSFASSSSLILLTFAPKAFFFSWFGVWAEPLPFLFRFVFLRSWDHSFPPLSLFPAIICCLFEHPPPLRVALVCAGGEAHTQRGGSCPFLFLSLSRAVVFSLSSAEQINTTRHRVSHSIEYYRWAWREGYFVSAQGRHKTERGLLYTVYVMNEYMNE